MAHLERLLVNLRIVSKIEPFQKLNTKSGETLVIESGEWGSGSLARWARGDHRTNTMKRLNELYDAVTDASKKPLSPRRAERLRQHVGASRLGLRNLRQTYESDVTMTAHYDVLLDKVADLVGVEEAVEEGAEED